MAEKRVNIASWTKNVGKSFGYAMGDTFKKYNPVITNIAREAKENASSAYSAIKNIGFSKSSIDEKNLKGEVRDTVSDIFKNLKDDIKTGNFYNKQRANAMDDALMGAMGMDMSDFDFDFDDEDWGDDLDSSSTKSSSTAAEMAGDLAVANKQSAQLATAMSVVGSKTASAVASATTESASYIVAANKQHTKALYDMNQRGFAQVTSGLVSVNNTIAEFAKIGEPLTAHMNNFSIFATKTTDSLNKIQASLEQIAKNTTPAASATGMRPRTIKGTFSDIFTDEGISINSMVDMVKENFKGNKDLIDMGLNAIKGMKAGSGGGSIGKNISLMTYATKWMSGFIIPAVMKKSMENLNEAVKQFSGAAILKAKNMSTGNWILDMIKDSFLPQSGYKDKISSGNYEKGRVSFDGITRQAITKVIPEVLFKIYSSITGDSEMTYNYDTGKFVKRRDVAKAFSERKQRAAEEAAGDFRKDVLNAIQSSSGANKAQLVKEVSDFFVKTLADQGLLLDIRNKDYLRDHKSSGLSKDSLQILVDTLNGYRKAGKTTGTKALNQFALGADEFGNWVRSQEASGNSVYSALNDGWEEEAKKSGITASKRGMFFDEYKHDQLYYLRQIYLYTQYATQYSVGTPVSGSKGLSFEKFKTKTSNAESRLLRKQSEKKDKERRRVAEEEAAKLLEREASSSYKDEMFMTEAELEQREKEEKKDETSKKVEGFKDRTKNRITNILGLGKNAPGWIGRVSNGVSNLLNSIGYSLDGLIWGKDNGDYDPKKGLFGFIFDHAEKFLDKAFNKFFHEDFRTKMNGWIDKLLGEKDENGKRKFKEGGIAEFFDRTKKELANIGRSMLDPVKSFFGKGKVHKVDQAARGRKVTKPGVIAVSGGELIIPSEMNPYYHGATNKAFQIANERRLAENFYGHYALGGSIGDTVAFDLEGRKRAIYERNKNNPRFMKRFRDRGFTLDDDGKGREFIREGVDYIANGIKKVFNTLVGDPDKDPEKEKDKINKTIVDQIKKDVKDKETWGAMGAGGIIGGLGLPLLTGSLLGPVAGLAIGAGVGFLSKSKAARNALFGEFDLDNNQTKKGLLPKSISEFIMKNTKGIANAGKGAGIGFVAGTVLGSPILGAFAGSAIGFIQKSDAAKNVIFGKVGEDGEREGGIISKELQKKIKKASPGMSAGMIAGLVAGPFGIVGNLAMGASLGYLATSDRFKAWMFGGTYTDPKTGKKKNYGWGFVGKVKDKIFGRIESMFKNVGSLLFSGIKNMMAGAVDHVTNLFRKITSGAGEGKGPFGWLKRGLGFGLRRVGNVLGGAVGLVGRTVNGINTFAYRHNLRAGNAAFSDMYDPNTGEKIKKGHRLTAAERVAERAKGHHLGQGSMIDQFDQALAGLSEDAINSGDFSRIDQLQGHLETLSKLGMSKEDRAKAARELYDKFGINVTNAKAARRSLDLLKGERTSFADRIEAKEKEEERKTQEATQESANDIAVLVALTAAKKDKVFKKYKKFMSKKARTIGEMGGLLNNKNLYDKDANTVALTDDGALGIEEANARAEARAAYEEELANDPTARAEATHSKFSRILKEQGKSQYESQINKNEKAESKLGRVARELVEERATLTPIAAYATGGRVTKPGLITVSAGEIILPPGTTSITNNAANTAGIGGIDTTGDGNNNIISQPTEFGVMQYKRDTNGDMEPNIADKQTRETLENRDEFQGSIKKVGKFGGLLSSIGGKISDLFGYFFKRDKEDKKPSLIESILSGFTAFKDALLGVGGKGGIFSRIISAITGRVLGGSGSNGSGGSGNQSILSKILDKISLITSAGGFLATIAADVGLLGAYFGAFDEAAHESDSEYGDPDQQTVNEVIDPNGVRWIQLSDGRWQNTKTGEIRDEPPEGSIEQEVRGDHNTLSKQMWTNTLKQAARGSHTLPKAAKRVTQGAYRATKQIWKNVAARRAGTSNVARTYNAGKEFMKGLRNEPKTATTASKTINSATDWMNSEAGKAVTQNRAGRQAEFFGDSASSATKAAKSVDDVAMHEAEVIAKKNVKNGIDVLSDNLEDGLTSKVPELNGKAGPIRKALKAIKDKIMDMKFTKAIMDKVKDSGIKAFGQGVKEVIKEVPLAGWFVRGMEMLTDYMTGKEDAADMLGVLLEDWDIPTGWRILCGLTRMILNQIPFIGPFIPEKPIMELLVALIGPAFGIDSKTLHEQQEKDERYLAEYNAKYRQGVNQLTTDEYRKQVRGIHRGIDTSVSSQERSKSYYNSSKYVQKAAAKNYGYTDSFGNTVVLGMNTDQDIMYRNPDEWNKDAATYNSKIEEVKKQIAAAEAAGDYGAVAGLQEKLATYEDNQAISYANADITRLRKDEQYAAFNKRNEIKPNNSDVELAKKAKDFGILQQGHPNMFFSSDQRNAIKKQVDQKEQEQKSNQAVKSDKELLAKAKQYGFIGESVDRFYTSDMRSIIQKKVEEKDATFITAGSASDQELINKAKQYGLIPPYMDKFYTSDTRANIAKQVKEYEDLHVNANANTAQGINYTTDSRFTAKGSGIGGASGFVSQNDPRWANQRYANGNVGELGCGPAVATMVAGGYDMNQALNDSKKYQANGGTRMNYFTDTLARRGIGTSQIGAGDVKSALRSGHEVIMLGRDGSNKSKANSPFGPNSHYVLATGMDGDTITVNDPEAEGPTKYSSSNLLKGFKAGLAAGFSGLVGGGKKLKNMTISQLESEAKKLKISIPAISDKNGRKAWLINNIKQTRKTGKAPSISAQTGAGYDVLLRIIDYMWEREMGHQGPGRVAPPLNDGAGKNYGMFSFTQRHGIGPLTAYIKKKFPELGKKLTASPGSTEYDRQFKKLGETDTEAFKAAQVYYVFDEWWLKGVVANIKKHTGIDLNDGTFTEGVASLALETYNWAPAMYIGSGGDWGISDIIKKEYGKKITPNQFLKVILDKIIYRSNASSSQYKNAWLNRWPKSYENAKKLNKTFKYTSSGVYSGGAISDTTGDVSGNSASSGTSGSNGWLAQIQAAFNQLGRLVGEKPASSNTSTDDNNNTDNSTDFTEPVAGNLKGWISTIKDVKQKMAAQKPIYYTHPGSKKYHTITTADGRKLSLRADCSGLVSGMVKAFKPKFEGLGARSLDFANRDWSKMKAVGFESMPWKSWNNLQTGDIIAANYELNSKPGYPDTPGVYHVEVFGKNENGRHLVWNGGGDSSLQSAGLTGSSKKGYQTVWRYTGKGSGLKDYVGGGNVGRWLANVSTVKQRMAAQNPIYWDPENKKNTNKMHLIEGLSGKKYEVRPDCSGLVSGMVKSMYPGFKGLNYNSAAFANPNWNAMKKAGFTSMKWPGWTGLNVGDIIASNPEFNSIRNTGDTHHVEVFSGNISKYHHNVYSGGNTKTLRSSVATKSGHNDGYQTVWRYTGGNSGLVAGASGVNNELAVLAKAMLKVLEKISSNTDVNSQIYTLLSSTLGEDKSTSANTKQKTTNTNTTASNIPNKTADSEDIEQLLNSLAAIAKG